MFCSVISLLEQRSSRYRWNSVLTKAKWNSVNRHLFKLQPGLPCWPILTFFSKLETFPCVHNDEHKFLPANTLFALDQSEFLMDRLCYQILLLHFITFFSIYRTIYNPARCLVILHY
jgi:hypothetical protein